MDYPPSYLSEYKTVLYFKGLIIVNTEACSLLSFDWTQTEQLEHSKFTFKFAM